MTYNWMIGCQHDCLYCYAKEMAIRRRRVNSTNWKQEKVRTLLLHPDFYQSDGRIMAPSTHDITPDYLEEAVNVYKGLLSVGNRVVIVSKPHMSCIERLCHEFQLYQSQILFRFSIGSVDDRVLDFWEPHAPCFYERFDCLKHAYVNGYETSVSCEPMLDDHVEDVIEYVRPYITETIWIGKVNQLKKRLQANGHTDPETMDRANQLLAWQQKDRIWDLYRQYENDPMIRWKDSIRKITGAKNPDEVPSATDSNNVIQNINNKQTEGGYDAV